MSKLAQYLKAIVPALATVAYAIQAALVDGSITNEEWRTIIAGAVTTVLVWALPNKPPAETPA